MIKKLLPLLFALIGLGSSAQIVSIPDVNFKNALLNYSPAIDINLDGEIQVSEAILVTRLEVSLKNIGNLTGILSFTNLNTLTCRYNQLTTLDLTGLSNLDTLRCSNNLLSTINLSGLTGLISIDCENNNLTSLNVSGFNNLKQLFCSNNYLTSLNVNGCSSLFYLRCSGNRFVTLDFSSSGLLELNSLICEENLILTSLNLNSLNKLSYLKCEHSSLNTINLAGLDSLKFMYCAENQLTSLTLSGSSKLSVLGCAKNKLASLIINGSPLLSTLDCSNNLLTTINLNELTNLGSLTCNQNLLTSLDIGTCYPMFNLNCSSNQLTSLNLKNGPVSLTSFSITGNANLQYVCADEAEISALQTTITQQGLSNVNINSYCSFTPGGQYNTITGTVKVDLNINGCDAADPVTPAITMKIDNGTNIGYTSATSLGMYSFYTNSGNFTVTPQLQNAYFNVSPASINFANAGSNTQTTDFCIVPNGVHNDLEVSIIAVIPARPGFDAMYKLVYKNKGTTILSGNVDLNFEDDKIDFLNATPAAATQSTGLLTWSYSNLLPFESRTITVSFNVLPPPTNNNTDTLSFTSNVTPLSADETPLDNSFTMKQVLVGSFDPNDKTCLEGARIAITRVGDYVHYLVRFQNTGTFIAENVVVKDMLQNNLDWNSVQLIKSSHPCIFRQINGNKLEFIFESINLPAQSVDEPGSHGYIAFKVKTIGSLLVGDQVDNSASIYFDFNLPVITNTASALVSSDIVIPISVEYFKGSVQWGKHLLNWKVNCASTQAVFNVERSTGAVNYTSIYNITASNTRCLQPFDFVDANPAAGMNYYRIKMTDVDGKVSYSSIIALLNKKAGFEIVNLLPNPVTNGTALLNLTSAKKQVINISVTDAAGKIVQSVGQSIIAGFTQLNMNFNKLAAGIYTIILYTDDGERKTTQFVKQ